MQKPLVKSTFFSSAVLGLFFLLLFIGLEIVNRWKFQERFPLALFTFAWVLQAIFILLVAQMIKDLRLGKSVLSNPLIFFLRVGALVLVAYIWGRWVVDQWQCLMGVPNCD